jgi:starch synthase
MTKAVAQIMGISLHENGTTGKVEPKNVVSLKKWYEEVHNFLPEKAILIQSTSSHAWPYPAYIFKRATWAYIDLIFFLPEIPMTFIGEHDGKAYRTKTTSIFFDALQNNLKTKNTQLKRVNSSFFIDNLNPSQ